MTATATVARRVATTVARREDAMAKRVVKRVILASKLQ